ncbi:MAG: NAD(P)-dependent oxidoreductase [Clostridia bacterium]|nr:NAD(P)-dependent oxidoreductase [Clostridia bacterium]
MPCNTTPAAQIWDYVYVDDIAKALWCIAKNGVHGKRYPIGSGIARSLKSYIAEIAEATGSDELMKGVGKMAYREDQVMNLLADITELTGDTGFTCDYGFTEGLAKTIEFVSRS